VADRFAAADQTYATITEFLRSEEARQVKPSLDFHATLLSA